MLNGAIKECQKLLKLLARYLHIAFNIIMQKDPLDPVDPLLLVRLHRDVGLPAILLWHEWYANEVTNSGKHMQHTEDSMFSNESRSCPWHKADRPQSKH